MQVKSPRSYPILKSKSFTSEKDYDIIISSLFIYMEDDL